MLSPRFIPESVFYTQSVVRSPCFILTDGKALFYSFFKLLHGPLFDTRGRIGTVLWFGRRTNHSSGNEVK